jgi:general secretion pathway protein L
MSLLRIYCSLQAAPPRCRWSFGDVARKSVHGEGTLADVPRGAERVHLVIPAAEVVFTRVKLPQGAKRRAGSVLAFAVEDQTLGEPEANLASWLGMAGDSDVLAVMDKNALQRWLDALDAAGFYGYELHCETLLLPRAAGEWTLAWAGREGFVRTGDIEGAATDCGDQRSPPLSLRLMVDAAATGGESPAAIAVYTIAAAAAPDLDAWQRELGVSLRLAGVWDWRTARQDGGVNLMQQRRTWRLSGTLVTRLRSAAWIAGAALALHALALVTDWAFLRGEQRALRLQMEARFRAVVPDAVAVVDPALQMRRKLAAARRVAGVADTGDFLPMIEIVAVALKELPAGSLRGTAYEQGRLALELSGIDEAAARRFVARLLQSGANIDAAIAPARSGSGAFVVTVRAS